MKTAYSHMLKSSYFFGLLLAVPALVRAQSYQIDWFTIDGGGGASTGGAYAISGTIGQPDAGVMSGGTFALEGGFWPGALVASVPAAPLLQINRAGPGLATISWSPASPGFVLQVNSTLAPSGWTNAPSTGTNPITVPVGEPMRFYRLRNP